MDPSPTTKLRKNLTRLYSLYERSRQRVKEEKQALRSARVKVRDAVQAQEIVQLVAQAVQQQAHGRVGGIVSRCLRLIFDEPYDFRIIFERKRGRTEARPAFLLDELELDPMEDMPGGAIDVTCFALRAASLVLSRPKKRPSLFLDEPFKHLRPLKKYGPRVRELLDTLSTELGLQITQVTHSRLLATGRVISLE